MKKMRKKLHQKLRGVEDDKKDVVEKIERELSQNIPDPETLPDATAVVNSCSRKVIGYITSGGYAFSVGKSIGKGCIVTACIRDLKNASNPLVLVRSTNSLQYRFAYIQIPKDINW